MENQNQSLIVAMPTDDELYQEFIVAIRDGVHENIKNVVNSISGYIGKAKDELKNLIHVDPQNGLSLDINIAKGDQILDSFINKQGLLMRNALKILLSTVGARTFSNFVIKTKKSQEEKDITIRTFSNIMTIFFTNLSKKYLINESEANIKEKIRNLFN